MIPALTQHALDTPSAITDIPTVRAIRPVPTATLTLPFPAMLDLKRILAGRLLELDRTEALECRKTALRSVYDEVCLSVGAEPGSL